MNLKEDSQDSRNSDLLHLEDDLSKDLQEIIALDKIKSAPKSRKSGVTEYMYGSSGRVYSNPLRPRSKQKNRNSVALIENTLQSMVAILESLLQS